MVNLFTHYKQLAILFVYSYIVKFKSLLNKLAIDL